HNPRSILVRSLSFPVPFLLLRVSHHSTINKHPQTPNLSLHCLLISRILKILDSPLTSPHLTILLFTGSTDSAKSRLATELRLGLPGSRSPERDPQLFLLGSRKLDERPLFPVIPLKDISALPCQKAGVSGNK
ncbi:Auxin-responsive protein IAA9-like protein, partial [Drosera capensis]